MVVVLPNSSDALVYRLKNQRAAGAFILHWPSAEPSRRLRGISARLGRETRLYE